MEFLTLPSAYSPILPCPVPAIDLDYHASGSRRRTVLFCMDNGKPALTDRLRLVQETETKAYGVVLMHPGVNLTTQPDVWPRDLASIVVRIRDLISRAAENQGESSMVYIYDKSDSSGSPLFLGGAEVIPQKSFEKAEMVWVPEIELEDLRHLDRRHYFEEDVFAANKEWTVVVMALPGTFEPDLVFIVLGGCIFIVASMFLALWVRKIAASFGSTCGVFPSFSRYRIRSFLLLRCGTIHAGLPFSIRCGRRQSRRRRGSYWRTLGRRPTRKGN